MPHHPKTNIINWSGDLVCQDIGMKGKKKEKGKTKKKKDFKVLKMKKANAEEKEGEPEPHPGDGPANPGCPKPEGGPGSDCSWDMSSPKTESLAGSDEVWEQKQVDKLLEAEECMRSRQWTLTQMEELRLKHMWPGLI